MDQGHTGKAQTEVIIRQNFTALAESETLPTKTQHFVFVPSQEMCRL